MKKIAIYFSDPEPMGDPFNKKYPYFAVYKEIIEGVEKQGIEVYIVRGKSYLGEGVFSHGWKIKDTGVVPVNEQIKVDLIFHKGNFFSTFTTNDCLIINHPDFERLCYNKARVAELFPDFSPKTKAINSYQEFAETVSEWGCNPEEKIVVKKNFLSGGRGIYVRPVKDLTEFLYENWQDVLVQEFIDSSVGIPGIVEGLHDIRIVTMNGEPAYSFVRIPPAGSFLANVSQGGSERAVSLDKLPSELLEMVAKINQKFIHYKPSILGADFFNSKDGFKLIELNAPPAVCDPDQSPETRKYIDKLVEFLVRQLT